MVDAPGKKVTVGVEEGTDGRAYVGLGNVERDVFREESNAAQVKVKNVDGKAVVGIALMDRLHAGEVMSLGEDGDYKVGTKEDLGDRNLEFLDVVAYWVNNNGVGWREVSADPLEGETITESSQPAPSGKSTGGNTGAKDKKESKEPRMKKEKVIQKCACGCGSDTASQFAMGHDSKLRKAIQNFVDDKDATKGKVASVFPTDHPSWRLGKTEGGVRRAAAHHAPPRAAGLIPHDCAARACRGTRVAGSTAPVLLTRADRCIARSGILKASAENPDRPLTIRRCVLR